MLFSSHPPPTGLGVFSVIQSGSRCRASHSNNISHFLVGSIFCALDHKWLCQDGRRAVVLLGGSGFLPQVTGPPGRMESPCTQSPLSHTLPCCLHPGPWGSRGPRGLPMCTGPVSDHQDFPDSMGWNLPLLLILFLALFVERVEVSFPAPWSWAGEFT